MAVIGVKSITGITSITNAASASDVLTFHSNNTTERVRITSAGQVGVGINNPSSPGSYTKFLEVSDNNAASIIVSRSASGTAHKLEMGAFSGASLIESTGATSLRFKTNSTERLRIGTGGGGSSIGISTTLNMVTNSEVLAVRGYSSFKSNDKDYAALYVGNEGNTNNTANALILFNQGGANRSGIGYVPNTGEFRINNQYYMTFCTGASTLGGTERLRITATGNVNQTIGADAIGFNQTAAGNNYVKNVVNANRSGANAGILALHGQWNSKDVAAIKFRTGADTSNKDDGHICFETSSANNIGEKVRIDNGGRVLVGTPTARQHIISCHLQVEGTNQPGSSISLCRNSNDVAPPNLIFAKSRGTSVGSNTVVQSGDWLAYIAAVGADGTDTDTESSSIRMKVDATPGSNDMPGRIEFHTTPNDSATPAERVRITSAGELKINHEASGVSANAGANEFSIEGGNVDIGMSFISPAANNRTQTIAFGDSSNTIAGRIQYAHGDDSLRFRTGDTERLMLTGGGQLIQYTTHTTGNSAHSNTSWYGDDANQYNIQVRDFNEMYATKLTNSNSYQQIIYKREKMTHFCDVEFTLSADSDQAGSGYYHLAMPICGDGSDTLSNFDILVFRANGGNTGLNQVRVDKGGGGYGFNVTSSSIPAWFDGAERHIQIKIRGRRYSIYSDGVEITTQYSTADNPRQNGFFGFAIYEASTVNPWIKIRDFKIRNHSLNTALPSWEVVKDVKASTNNSSVFECSDLNNPRTVEIRFWRLRHSGGNANTYLKLRHTGGYASGSIYSDIGQYQTHNSTAATMARGYLQSVGWCPMHWDFTNSTNYYSGFIRINRITNPGVNHKFTYESSITVDYDSGNTQYWIRCNGRMDMGSANDWDGLSLYTSSGTNFVYGDVSILAQY